MKIKNFKILSHDLLAGHGGMGEGLSISIARDGRRILWCAHESAPKNFTGVDVTDPRKPRVVVQTELPHGAMRSNSLECSGNILAVAYQCTKVGMQPAGFELFDVSVPETPKSIGFFDASGPHSRGVHQLWFCDGETVHMAAGSADFVPRHPNDDQFYRIVDVRNPSKPEEVGRWWLPGTHEGDDAPPPVRHEPRGDGGFRAHNTNVYARRPDRCYLGYLDAGMFVLDISDRANPKPLCQWDNSPPYKGFTHTVLPLFDRELLVVTDESIHDEAADWPKLIWIVDYRDERRPVPIATCPTPTRDEYGPVRGRYGAHNLHENVPVPTAWNSEDVVVGSFFGGGLRAYDIRNPYAPVEIAHFAPPGEANAPTGACQLNDVFIDERGIVYTVDRHVGGLYVLEMDF